MPKKKKPGILTARKKELLICLSRDNSYKLAAGIMGISFETVKSHVNEMREDFELHSVFAIFAVCVKTYQIKPEDL